MAILGEEGSAAEEYLWPFYFVDAIDFDFDADNDVDLTMILGFKEPFLPLWNLAVFGSELAVLAETLSYSNVMLIFDEGGSAVQRGFMTILSTWCNPNLSKRRFSTRWHLEMESLQAFPLNPQSEENDYHHQNCFHHHHSPKNEQRIVWRADLIILGVASSCP